MHIVLLHTFGAAWLPESVDRLVRWGASTSSLFFILSGFILTYVYAVPGAGLRIGDGEFWKRRAVRLYPLALAGHLVVLPLVWGGYPPGERWARAAAAVGGVQAFWPPFATSFNAPAWSLSFLGLGFLLLPGLLRRTARWGPRRLQAALGGLWLAMLVPPAAFVALAPADHVWAEALFTFPLVRLPEFLFGVVLARLLAARNYPAAPPWAAPVALAGVAASLALTPEALFPFNHNGLYAPLHAILLWGVALGGGALARALSHPAAERLGQASFAIFLLHAPLHAWAMTLTGGSVAGWGTVASAAFYLLYITLTIALGDVAERRFVAPLARRLKRSRAVRGAALPAHAGRPV